MYVSAQNTSVNATNASASEPNNVDSSPNILKKYSVTVTAIPIAPTSPMIANILLSLRLFIYFIVISQNIAKKQAKTA